LGVRGAKSKEQRFVEGSWRTDGQKNGSIPSRNKKKKQFEVFFVTDRQTDIQTEEQTDRVNC